MVELKTIMGISFFTKPKKPKNQSSDLHFFLENIGFSSHLEKAMMFVFGFRVYRR